jgi:hypothetical protein
MTEKSDENKTGNSFSHLTDEDLNALQEIKRSNEWLRAILCTLARRGVSFRKKHPERSKEILMILIPLPYFKAGQFLFDLMEWEDFMLDGPPPPVLTTVLDTRAIKQLTSLFNMIKSHFDGSQSPNAGQAESAGNLFGQHLHVEISNLIVDDRQLPPLESGFYLYQDVVLGIYASALQSEKSLSSLVSPPESQSPEEGTPPPKQLQRSRKRKTGIFPVDTEKRPTEKRREMGP